MKIFSVEFDPMYPVPCGLIIAAETEERAKEIAENTITHTKIKSIVEVDISKECVVFYESGDY